MSRDNREWCQQAGVTQLVECNLAKVDVAGSNPVSRSISSTYRTSPNRNTALPMPKVDVYLKIELDLDADEKPEKIAQELCKQVRKVYSVRAADVSSIVPRD